MSGGVQRPIQSLCLLTVATVQDVLVFYSRILPWQDLDHFPASSTYNSELLIGRLVN